MPSEFNEQDQQQGGDSNTGNNYSDRAMHKDEVGRVHIHPFVFWASTALIVLFVIGAVVLGTTAEQGMSAVQSWMTAKFGWLYILSMSIFLILAVSLVASRFRSLRLAAQAAEPAFSLMALLAMLFSAGMGIGLLFWSVAEPIYHYQSPPDHVAVHVESVRQGEVMVLEKRAAEVADAANQAMVQAELAYEQEPSVENEAALREARQASQEAVDAANPDVIAAEADAVADLELAGESMRLTFFHWGLHPWGVYALLGLGLAYFGYRHDLPLTVRFAGKDKALAALADGEVELTFRSDALLEPGEVELEVIEPTTGLTASATVRVTPRADDAVMTVKLR